MAEEIVRSLSGFVGGVCMTLIGVALIRLPRKPVARPLYAFVAAGSLWAIGDLVADGAVDMTWKRVGLTMLYTGSIPVAALWWMTAVRWADDVGARLGLRHPAWQWGPLAFAGSMWLAMITNPWHGEFITPVVGGRNLYGPIWYVMAIHNYFLILAALGVEIVAARRVASLEVRRQAGFLIAASLVTLLGNIAYVVDLLPFNGTVLVLSVSSALLVVGMARDGLFGVLPSALPSIADDHPDGLVVVGPDRRVRYANERAGELLAPLEVTTDAPVWMALDDDRLQAEGKGHRANPVGEEEWWDALSETNGLVVRVEGESVRWLHASAQPVVGRGGWTKGYWLRIADHTAQRHSELHERQVRRLDSVASLARAVSRDFQRAFSVILGNAELMSNVAASAPENQRKLARIVEASRSGLDLAHQLQICTGTVDVDHKPVSLSAVVEEMCAMVEDDEQAPLVIARAMDASPLLVEADPIQIRQALFELLSNAVEAMHERRGAVRVETGLRRLEPGELENLVAGAEEPIGDFAYACISDEAGGMALEVEERAFEPFYGTRGKDRGNGLSTVLGIVRAHEGLLAVSNRVGQGCAITLYLPLSPDVDTRARHPLVGNRPRLSLV